MNTNFNYVSSTGAIVKGLALDDAMRMRGEAYRRGETGQVVSDADLAKSWGNSHVIAASAARVSRQQAALASLAGADAVAKSSMSALVAAAGTGVLMEAYGRFHIERSELVASGRSDQNARAVAEVIRAEDRQDFIVDLADLCIGPQGGLTRGGGVLALEPLALRQLVEAVAPGHSRAMADYPAATRSQLWGSYYAPLANGRRKLRTRRNPGAMRTAFAVAGTGYAGRGDERNCDGDVALDAIADALEALDRETYGPALYDGTTGEWSVDVGYMPESIKGFSVGDLTRIVMRFFGSDAAQGAIGCRVYAYNNRCYNYIVVGELSYDEFRIAHRGDVRARFEERLPGAMVSAQKLIDAFGEDMDMCRTVHAPSFLDVQGATAAQTRELCALELVRRGSLARRTGVDRDVIVQTLIANVEGFDGGDDVGSWIDGVTRLHACEAIPAAGVESAQTWAAQLVREVAASVR